MALKTKLVTISEQGRDYGKTFLITELPAVKAEKWALRALLLAAQSGAQVPDNLQSGIAGLAIIGIQSVIGGLRFADVEPLLDEMMACVQFVPDLRSNINPRPMIDEDTEEVATRFRLRQEWLDLHVGFSMADALSNSMKASADPASGSSPTTSTSPASSAP